VVLPSNLKFMWVIIKSSEKNKPNF
jgi:hypothetical protein